MEVIQVKSMLSACKAKCMRHAWLDQGKTPSAPISAQFQSYLVPGKGNHFSEQKLVC
jgi:hypothetical protein